MPTRRTSGASGVRAAPSPLLARRLDSLLFASLFKLFVLPRPFFPPWIFGTHRPVSSKPCSSLFPVVAYSRSPGLRAAVIPRSRSYSGNEGREPGGSAARVGSRARARGELAVRLSSPCRRASFTRVESGCRGGRSRAQAMAEWALGLLGCTGERVLGSTAVGSSGYQSKT